MKHSHRFLGVVLFFVMFSLCLPSFAFAAGPDVIHTENSADGYFTVEYYGAAGVKMKVGVAHAGTTVYYNYTPGTKSAYVFTMGDGNYTLSLYQNISGTSYKKVATKKVYVELKDEYAIYRVSTAEITFAEDDAVGLKAAELCKDKRSDEEKLVEIHNYIAGNFTYDYDFAKSAGSSAAVNYVPNSSKVLEAKKGVCYDFAVLFAAMSRSQGFACKVVKGYLKGEYHAWNSIYIDGEWKAIDLTRSVCKKNAAALQLADCLIPAAELCNYVCEAKAA